MPHVTFIHGIANKPPADDLLSIWCRTLAEAAEPMSLSDIGVTSSLVYWADLMYESPDLPPGPHTIEIRVADAKHPDSRYTWVNVDRIEFE